MGIRLAKKNIGNDHEQWQRIYENEIVRRIRQRYTVNQELAILRQRDTKPDEYAEYNAFVEQCKADIKAEMNK